MIQPFAVLRHHLILSRFLRDCGNRDHHSRGSACGSRSVQHAGFGVGVSPRALYGSVTILPCGLGCCAGASHRAHNPSMATSCGFESRRPHHHRLIGRTAAVSAFMGFQATGLRGPAPAPIATAGHRTPQASKRKPTCVHKTSHTACRLSWCNRQGTCS